MNLIAYKAKAKAKAKTKAKTKTKAKANLCIFNSRISRFKI